MPQKYKVLLLMSFVLIVGFASSGTAPQSNQESNTIFVPFVINPDDSQVVISAEIVGDPIYFTSFGDLWMSTWSDDDRLIVSWGDGVGFGGGYPYGFPAYLTSDPVTITSCGKFELFCQLFCNMNSCDADSSYPAAALTDTGILAFEGPVPGFTDVEIRSIDVPSGEPFFLRDEMGQEDTSGNNDKPSSLLFIDGRLYLAGHYPAGSPTHGYLAYSEDLGQTWQTVAGSPWGEKSNFRVLMFINMGQNYSLNSDGFIYALGVGSEGIWVEKKVYLARVPRDSIISYSSYEYFSGMNGIVPTWSADQTKASSLQNLSTTLQASAIYHEGSGRYLFMTTEGGFSDSPPGTGALFEAPFPWGPWNEVSRFCFDYSCNDGTLNLAWTDGKYIPGLIPKGAGPDHVFFTVSGGDDHYQLQIGMLALELAR